MDLVAKNMIMDYYCSTEKYVKAETLFNKMQDEGELPDSFSYSTLIKGLK